MATRVRALRYLVIPLAVLCASGCGSTAAEWERGGWPAPITVQGKRALGLWQGALIASLIIGGVVLLLIVGSAILWRRRSPAQMPRQVRYNLPVEVMYTFVPIVIVAILFYFTATTENFEDKISPGPALNVNVVGFQWSWRFNYLDNGLSVVGRTGTMPQLVIPVGEKIHFYETSPDVIHSFWVVPFDFKRDIIPGRINQFEVTPTKTGVFKGECAEYCGLYHSQMRFSVKILPKAQYAQWLAQAKATAAAGTNPGITTYTGPKELTTS